MLFAARQQGIFPAVNPNLGKTVENRNLTKKQIKITNIEFEKSPKYLAMVEIYVRTKFYRNLFLRTCKSPPNLGHLKTPEIHDQNTVDDQRHPQNINPKLDENGSEWDPSVKFCENFNPQG